MKNSKTFIPVLFLLVFSFQHVRSQEFTLEYSDSHRNLTIQSDQIRITSEWVSPSIQPAVPMGDWEHVNRTVVYDELAGMPGQRTTDVFSSLDITIERQVWISMDHKVMFLITQY